MYFKNFFLLGWFKRAMGTNERKCQLLGKHFRMRCVWGTKWRGQHCHCTENTVWLITCSLELGFIYDVTGSPLSYTQQLRTCGTKAFCVSSCVVWHRCGAIWEDLCQWVPWWKHWGGVSDSWAWHGLHWPLFEGLIGHWCHSLHNSCHRGVLAPLRALPRACSCMVTVLLERRGIEEIQVPTLVSKCSLMQDPQCAR